MKKDRLIGYVIVDEREVKFVADGYKFTFLYPDLSSLDHKRKEIIICPNEQGFIIGKTVDGHMIYIYTHSVLNLKSVCILNTWLYIISECSIHSKEFDHFQGIEFFGGTLTTLFPSQSLHRNEFKKNHIILNYTPDDLKYLIKTMDMEGEIRLSSVVREQITRLKGFEITNGDARLELSFSDTKQLGEFNKLYGVIVTLVQFMAFRENIGFDKVSLLQRDSKYGYLSSVATCYIQEYESWTKKDDMRCITFRDLEDSVVNLIDSIFKNADKKPSYCVNFLPKNDDEVLQMNNTKLREVCSAIECEMELANINLVKDERFDKLVSDVKEIVKKHRDGEEPLAKKSYDFIFGSISHWNAALADRIYETYMLHKEEVYAYLKNVDFEISKERINDLVKYRNQITHGIHKIGDEDIYVCALTLEALVYCCVLTRIGVSTSKIQELMERGVLLY